MWNPEQYNKYHDYRTRPALDLMNAIPDLAFRSVVDLGCGSGHITQMLQEKFKPDAITGIDSAASMLTKAKADFPDIHWQLGDIADLRESHDLIFSNAALQWLNDHARLFADLIGRANKAMAIQMPNNFQSPSHVLLRETINESPAFKAKLQNVIGEKPVIREDPVFAMEKYYALLRKHVARLDIWETRYLQQLSGDNPVLEWVKGTALVPVEAHLSAAEFIEFKQRYNAKLLAAYPRESDGTTLFPFSRLFIVAVK